MDTSSMSDAPAGPAGWGAARHSSETLDPEPRPLEAQIGGSASDGWDIRLPLRAERVSVDKQVVVAERVSVRRQPHPDTARLEASVQRERLRIDTYGDAPAPEISRRPRP